METSLQAESVSPRFLEQFFRYKCLLRYHRFSFGFFRDEIVVPPSLFQSKIASIFSSSPIGCRAFAYLVPAPSSTHSIYLAWKAVFAALLASPSPILATLAYLLQVWSCLICCFSYDLLVPTYHSGEGSSTILGINNLFSIRLASIFHISGSFT